MIKKNLLIFPVFFAFCMKSAIAQADTLPAFDLERTTQEITLQLSKDLAGHPHTQPLLIFIGGFPGAGKTTLIKALAETHDVTVISWNAIRQILLDKKMKDSPLGGEIIETVNQNLLKLCFQRHVNVVIDANAHAWNMSKIETFLRTQPNAQGYKVVKICLNPPVETLFKRVCAREQKEGIHQGTESDLRRDLNSSKKKLDLNDYALVLNTEEIPFETELKIVSSYLESCRIDQN